MRRYGGTAEMARILVFFVDYSSSATSLEFGQHDFKEERAAVSFASSSIARWHAALASSRRIVQDSVAQGAVGHTKLTTRGLAAKLKARCDRG